MHHPPLLLPPWDQPVYHPFGRFFLSPRIAILYKREEDPEVICVPGFFSRATRAASIAPRHAVLCQRKRVNIVPGKKDSTGVRPAQRSTKAVKTKLTTMDRVRDGVRRFILKETSIGDFYRAMDAAAGKGELSPHPLTGAAFRRIVKEAISERKRKTGKR